MKKLVMSLVLSLVLVASMQGGYSLAQTVPSGSNLEQKGNKASVCDDRRANLEKRAKELGISVDELKAQMRAEHQARLEKKAKEMGISVDELKAKLKAERQAKLEKKAKEMGITVDEFKARLKAEH